MAPKPAPKNPIPKPAAKGPSGGKPQPKGVRQQPQHKPWSTSAKSGGPFAAGFGIGCLGAGFGAIA